ncbi:unnamed protein product [Brassica oleracea]
MFTYYILFNITFLFLILYICLLFIFLYMYFYFYFLLMPSNKFFPLMWTPYGASKAPFYVI